MNTPILRLSKTQRLRTPNDFSRVYQSKQFGVSSHHSFNVLTSSSFTEPPQTTPSRLGITVSKKVSNKAVVRNLLKRQIREFYRSHQHQLNAADIVITARPSSSKVGMAERLLSLEQLWKKILKWQRWRDATQTQD